MKIENLDYTLANANYWQFCSYRLPCGICSRTMTICPFNNDGTKVTWDVTTNNGKDE